MKKHKFLFIVLVVMSTSVLEGQKLWHKSAGIDSLCTQTFFYSNNYLFAGTVDSGVYISTNNGISWYAANNGINLSYSAKSVNAFSQSSNKLYAAFGSDMSGNISSSDNNGAEWTPTNFPRGATDLVAIDSVLCASTGSGIFKYCRSTDYGKTWKYTNTLGYWRNYKKSNDSLFAISIFDGLIFSKDLGLTWQSIGFAGTHYFHDYFIYPGIIGIADENGIYLSPDNGTTWVSANTNGLSGDSSIIRYFTLAHDTVFASSDTAVYFSILSGIVLSPWTKINNSGLPILDTYHTIRSIQSINGFLLLGTENIHAAGSASPAKGMGIWYCSNLPTSVYAKKATSDNFVIYPNPAKDNIFIECPSFNDVSVDILSIEGRLLKSFVLQSAKTQIGIDNFTSGIYIVKVKKGKAFTIKKIIKQ